MKLSSEMKKNISSYGSEIKTIHSFVDAVRKTVGQYLGYNDTRGHINMQREIYQNAIDEIASGYADSLTCTLTKDGAIRVEDNGRGIPVEIHPEEGKPTVEVVLTVLHAGGKFDNNAYKTSGGLHGVGASVTNALSKYMKV